MKKTMKSTLRLAALALVAAYGISCCGGAKKACNTACGADCACGDSCACTAACAVDSAKLALQVYDPNQPLNLQDMNLFLEYDKTDTIKVSETVTRKFIYLNDLMTVIVDFDNGPMAQPDPPHSHPAEQISYVAIGECDVYIGDRPVQHLKTGDIFAVPSNVPHTVKSTTSNCAWWTALPRSARILSGNNPRLRRVWRGSASAGVPPVRLKHPDPRPIRHREALCRKIYRDLFPGSIRLSPERALFDTTTKKTRSENQFQPALRVEPA